MKAVVYSDIQLVEMISKGGAFRERAFIFLLEKERTEKRIERLLRGKGASPQECEEIIDEAMIALNTCILKGNFFQDGNIQAFLIGSSKNIWNKMWAKKNRQRHTIAIDSLYFPDTELNAEALVIKKEERMILVSYLNRLSEACKNILKLSFFEERTNDEIVKILGYKNKLVVSSKKSKCLRKLVTILNNENS